uniref:DUF4252 domain-containing protein n=1 Tax=Solibacter usitatus (strain Ellin6076) TaxID=234267 RepID=Q020Z5_SOLUE
MRQVRRLALASVLAGALWGQQFKFNLDHLEGKASDRVDVSLNSNMLQFAAKFLDTKDPDEAKVKQLISGMEGIYIRSFEFKKEGAYSAADLDQVRNQLKAPEWSRIFGIKNSDEGENIEVWVRNAGGKVAGIAILSSDPKQLTVANLVGNIDIDSLAALGGHFGLPKMDATKKKK